MAVNTVTLFILVIYKILDRGSGFRHHCNLKLTNVQMIKRQCVLPTWHGDGAGCV